MTKVNKKKFKKDQGLTFCRPEKIGSGLLGRTNEKWCKICGKRKRGVNHDVGSHHKAKA